MVSSSPILRLPCPLPYPSVEWKISRMSRHDGWFAARLAERLAESLHVQKERADRPEDLLGAIGFR